MWTGMCMESEKALIIQVWEGQKIGFFIIDHVLQIDYGH